MKNDLWNQVSEFIADIADLDDDIFLAVLDTSGTIIHLNSYFEQRLGYDLQNLKGKTFVTTLCVENEAKLFEKRLEIACRDLSPQKFRAHLSQSAGHMCQVLCILVSLINYDGKVNYVLLVGFEEKTELLS